MPMCDAYIPTGVLEPDVEQELIGRVSVVLAEHEMRRTKELMEDAEEIENMRKQALNLAWTFVHHTDHYFAGKPAEFPIYKFEVSIPEGQIDDDFRSVIVPSLVELVAEAEGHRFPTPEARVWVLLYEVPDGNWGAAGRLVTLKHVVDFIAPGWGDNAVERFDAIRRQQATTIVARAQETEGATT